MRIMAELAYYPFADSEFQAIIKDVISEFANFDLEISYSTVSTIVTGDHSEIMQLVDHIINYYFSKHLSILEVKYSNACFSEEIN